MNVETIEDLFLRELGRAYSIETALVDELATLRDDADVDALDSHRNADPREALKELLADYRTRTEEHVTRLEDAFEALGEQAETRSTPALDGIVAEKERFNNVVLNDEVRPPYYVGTAEEIVGLEIHLYERLVRLAEHLDVPSEVTDALERNREDAVETRDALQSLAGSDDLTSLIDGVVEATEYE